MSRHERQQSLRRFLLETAPFPFASYQNLEFRWSSVDLPPAGGRWKARLMAESEDALRRYQRECLVRLRHDPKSKRKTEELSTKTEKAQILKQWQGNGVIGNVMTRWNMRDRTRLMTEMKWLKQDQEADTSPVMRDSVGHVLSRARITHEKPESFVIARIHRQEWGLSKKSPRSL